MAAGKTVFDPARSKTSRLVTGEQFYVAACAGCHGDTGGSGRTGEEVRGEDADTDNDGVSDGDEVTLFGTDPLVADAGTLGREPKSRGGGAGGLPFLLLIALAGLLRSKERLERHPGTPVEGKTVRNDPD